MRIVAVDPGKKGRILGIDTQEPLGWFHKLQYTGNELSITQTESALTAIKPSVVILEKVRGRGTLGIQSTKAANWSASSNFNFGDTFGQIRTVLRYSSFRLGFSLGLLDPQTWQKTAWQGIETKLKPKEKSLIAYDRLFPRKPLSVNPRALSPDDGLIDCLLMIYHYLMNTKQFQDMPNWKFEEIK